MKGIQGATFRSASLFPTESKKSGERAVRTHYVLSRVTWDIAALSVYIDEVYRFWAKAVGISIPQWKILMAIEELDEESGVPINAVAKLLHVDPSFVTTQSRTLENKGLVRRRPSPNDARVVCMSLSDKMCEHLAILIPQQEALDAFVFDEFARDDVVDFTVKLSALKKRLGKARLKIAMDL